MLQIRFLGQFDVRADGRHLVISTRAAQSLFAFLVLNAGTPHRREKLAGLMWPDTREESARQSLRQELWRLRKAIGSQPARGDPASGAEEYLLTEELTIAFNPHAAYWLDVSQLETPTDDPETLQSNLSLYRGELLPGFYDDWAGLERERVQNVFERKMQQLMDLLVKEQRWNSVIEWSERWIARANARTGISRADGGARRAGQPHEGRARLRTLCRGDAK